jgi:hypothetical protein
MGVSPKLTTVTAMQYPRIPVTISNTVQTRTMPLSRIWFGLCSLCSSHNALSSPTVSASTKVNSDPRVSKCRPRYTASSSRINYKQLRSISHQSSKSRVEKAEHLWYSIQTRTTEPIASVKLKISARSETCLTSSSNKAQAPPPTTTRHREHHRLCSTQTSPLQQQQQQQQPQCQLSPVASSPTPTHAPGQDVPDSSLALTTCNSTSARSTPTRSHTSAMSVSTWLSLASMG